MCKSCSTIDFTPTFREGNEQSSWKGGGYQESNVLIPSSDKG